MQQVIDDYHTIPEKQQGSRIIQHVASASSQGQKLNSLSQQQNHTRLQTDSNFSSSRVTNSSANSLPQDASMGYSKKAESQIKETGGPVKGDNSRQSQPVDSHSRGQQLDSRHSQISEVSSSNKNARDKVRTNGGGDFQMDDAYGVGALPGRRPQNLPPRLANKLGRDGSAQNQVSSRPVNSDYPDSLDSGNRRTYFNDGSRDGMQSSRGPLKEQSFNSSGRNYANRMDPSSDQPYNKYRNHSVPHSRRDHQNHTQNQGSKQDVSRTHSYN